jgi:hypothetical protein
MPERLLAEAEEQLRRLEMIFAQLAEQPGGGRGAGTANSGAPLREAAYWHTAGGLKALAAEERRGAAETRALRDLAHLTGQHLAARLLDLSAEERAATAAELTRLTGVRVRLHG